MLTDDLARVDAKAVPLRVLIVEDREIDAELVVHELTRAGFDPTWNRVTSEPEYTAALDSSLDVILADFSLPGFGGLRALELLRASRLDIPFIVVSGSIGEETAVEVLKRGASDYLLKDRLARLGEAVRRSMDERRLQIAKREAEQRLSEQASLARLGEMAAVIAHEVKNPLAAVRGAVQVLGGRFATESRETKVVGEIIARIDALNDLVTSMLLFARPPQPRPTAIDVVQLVEATAAFARQDPNFGRVRMDVAGPPALVAADAELLKIALGNLLINSAAAMGGTGIIRVAIESDAGTCRIAVIDQGPGIPPNVRERIFTPFFTTKARGTGLGLPIAKRLIEAHSGSLDVSCPSTGGTTMTVCLPIITAAAPS
jgi:signal transduction histidine kinase